MRLWSLHPKYLDRQGLLALWREGLLAMKVLRGKTKGYKNHPQLLRFKNSDNTLDSINNYLWAVVKEARTRGYSFSQNKLFPQKKTKKINVSAGQLQYEWQHLLSKLKKRSPQIFAEVKSETKILAHPLFNKNAGKMAFWEKVKNSQSFNKIG